MHIGAHVSIAGGLLRAVGRGVDLECDAIQIFNQSSRAWRLQAFNASDTAAFCDGIQSSRIEAVLIHAVYLINAASLDREVRSKSLEALKGALELGDRIGAAGVVLHPGSQKKEDYERCMKAAGEAISEALAETDSCPLLLEDTAGAGGTLGRDLSELARLVELGGADGRIGVCLDCCHLLASGFEVRERDSLSAIVDDLELKLGLERLRALHINDSQMPL
ncbi:MAG: deoxyribonuclease IV, partial [Solirubrobacterales bacterium]